MEITKFNKWIFPKSKQIVNIVDIVNFESEIGISLPNQYKSFLLNCGIGKLYFNNIVVQDDNLELNLMITNFFSFEEIKDIYQGLQDFREFNPKADKLFPIASTHASPLVCIDLDENYGQIAILSWDSGVNLLNIDFYDFLNKLIFVDSEPDWKDPLFLI